MIEKELTDEESLNMIKKFEEEENKYDEFSISISCNCGEELKLYIPWQINIVGLIEFKCPKCNRIYRTKGLWQN